MKTYCEELLKTYCEELLKTYCEELLKTYCEELLKTYCEELLKTYCEELLKTYVYILWADEYPSRLVKVENIVKRLLTPKGFVLIGLIKMWIFYFQYVSGFTIVSPKALQRVCELGSH